MNQSKLNELNVEYTYLLDEYSSNESKSINEAYHWNTVLTRLVLDNLIGRMTRRVESQST